MITKDMFGSEYIVKVYDPKIGMEGFLVIDNTALGPGKGGIRMTANVNEEEVRRLARTMTWKNALSELSFGGAKAGIIWPGGSEELKKQYIQSFARLIKLFTPKKYIAGPDVNTGEEEMRWFVEATGNWRSATGKPADLCMKIFGKPGEKCGIPHEFGSTGFGVAHATTVALQLLHLDIEKSTVAIHGFGNVGTFTYQYLTDMGARVIALADSNTVILDKKGFDKETISKFIRERRKLKDYPKAEKINNVSFLYPDITFLTKKYGEGKFPNDTEIMLYLDSVDYAIISPQGLGTEFLRNRTALEQLRSYISGESISDCAKYQLTVAPNKSRCIVNLGEKIKTGSDVVIDNGYVFRGEKIIEGPAIVYCEWGCSFFDKTGEKIYPKMKETKTIDRSLIKNYFLPDGNKVSLFKINVYKN